MNDDSISKKQPINGKRLNIEEIIQQAKIQENIANMIPIIIRFMEDCFLQIFNYQVTFSDFMLIQLVVRGS